MGKYSLNTSKREDDRQDKTDVPEISLFHLQSSGVEVSYFIFSEVKPSFFCLFIQNSGHKPLFLRYYLSLTQ